MSVAGAAEARARKPLLAEGQVAALLIAVVAAVLVLGLALPLWSLLSKSFQDADGNFVGLANYARYLATPALTASLVNSVWVSALVTAIVTPVAFLYAYALTRSCMPMKGLFRAAILAPIFAPSLLPALSFIYIFGNQGFLRGWLFGASIYGPIGIVVAQVFYCLPHAVLILSTALALADGRLYEAAEAMGANRRRIFLTITLPSARYGLISAALVVFTLVITDFGIAKIIGGQFSVLATDAYKQVVGQQNFEMGAVVGVILLVPAALAFAIDRLQRRETGGVSARAAPYVPKPRLSRDAGLTLFCAIVAALLIAVIAVAVWASFIRYWPYNLSLTLANYDFANFDASGWSAYLRSLEMATIVAVLGAAFIFVGAYAVEKLKAFPTGRFVIQFLAILPMAVPGLVLGLGYVFFFNAPSNPLGFLYGSIALLALCSVMHFYTVAHVTSLTALKQLDPDYEAVSASLKAPFWRTFNRVTAPICLPAILDVAVYLFVNALTTVSAVIFLYGPNTKLAAVAIVHMDEAGAIAAAAALSTVIFATALAVKLAHLALDRLWFGRLQAWRKR